MLLIILIGAAYAYFNGYLDATLKQFGYEEYQYNKSSTSTSKAKTTTSSTKPTLSITEKKPTAVAIAVTTAKPSSVNKQEIEKLNLNNIKQLEAMQIRIASLENDMRNVLSIAENLDAKLDRQSGGVSAGLAKIEIIPLKLEIIDLQLRLTGDSISANRELEQLLPGLEGSQLEEIINDNRRRLATMTPRSQVFANIDKLNEKINETKIAMETQLAANEEAKNENDIPILNKLFTIKRENKTLASEVKLMNELALLVQELKPHILLNHPDGYVQTLIEIRIITDALQRENQSLDITEISGLITQLNASSNAENYLILDQLKVIK